MMNLMQSNCNHNIDLIVIKFKIRNRNLDVIVIIPAKQIHNHNFLAYWKINAIVLDNTLV